MLLKINSLHPQKRLIEQAVKILEQGGVIIYPTDTIYGLCCDLFNKEAIEKVEAIKGRDKNQAKHFSFICHDLSHIADFAQVSTPNYKILKKLLPGPFTFILPATKSVPKKIVSQKHSVGIRIPDNAVALALVKQLGRPIISTSVNPSDQPALSDPEEINEKFGKRVNLILDAGAMDGDPSTVVDLTGSEPVVLRQGKGKF